MPIHAAEYFVSLQGNDSNSGLSLEAPFLTIQRGVDALVPGDTLTIAPGEYFGAVYRKNLGNTEHSTLIRAQIPGTVLLRGDRDVADFRKAPDTKFVYSIPCDDAPQGVLEIDTLSSLVPLTSIQELETRPGSWFFDAGSKTLYFTTTDFAPPEKHRYSLSVVPKHGLYLENPIRVHVTGLAATGFSANNATKGLPGFNAIWGFMVYLGKDCVLENLTAYLNGGGISVQSQRTFKAEKHEGRGNRIIGSTAYGNGSQFNIEGGNIAIYFPNADEIADCTGYVGFPNGIRLYQLAGEFSRITNCFSRATHVGIQNKGKGAAERTRVVRSISLTTMHADQVENDIIGTSNYYHRMGNVETTRDNIYLSRGNIDQNAEFADPKNFDFRLQSTSQFRGSGPGGADRGPYPYEKTIYYVKPDGDDEGDGLSLKTAWKSAAKAFSQLKTGDTLYFEPGEYVIGEATLQKLGEKQRETSIRGRGLEPVVLRGALQLKDCPNLSMERLEILGPVKVSGTGEVRVKQCSLSGSPVSLQIDGPAFLEVTHSRFQGFAQAAIALGEEGKAARLFLQGNRFENIQSPALELNHADSVHYSGYNQFANPDKAWKLAGEEESLRSLPLGHEIYSTPLSSSAPGLIFAMPVGPHPPFERNLKISDPNVRSVSATTANLEWFASQPATCLLEWGTTEACENKASIDVSGYGTFSLTGLKPEQTYYFRIASVTLPEVLEDQLAVSLPTLRPRTISFTTASSDPPPKTYYVSIEGNNTNTGLAPDKSFRTIAKAADTVAPGDTVIIESGTYSEQIVIPTTGDGGRSITFQAKESGLVHLDGNNRSLTRAFIIGGKSDLRFDGFYSKDFGMPGYSRWPLTSAAIFNIHESRNIEITRSMNDGRGGGYSAPMINGWAVRNLLIKNCVAIVNAGAIRLRDCPDAIIENNVILRSNIQNMVLSNEPDDKITLRNNILGDNQASKVHVGTFEIRNAQAMIEGNNCYFFRIPDTERQPFLFGDTGAERRMSVADFSKRFSQRPSLVANPRFSGLSRVASDAPKEDYDGDAILRVENLRFSDFFSTVPEMLDRKIGLQPNNFEDHP